MKIENFKEKLVSLCEKEYHAQPRELTANQLHCAVSKLVMEELYGYNSRHRSRIQREKRPRKILVYREYRRLAARRIPLCGV